MFIMALFVIIKNQKQPPRPSTDEQIKNKQSNKNEHIIDTCNNMNELENNYVE